MPEIWIFVFIFGTNIHATDLKMDLKSCKEMLETQHSLNVKGVCINSIKPSMRFYHNSDKDMVDAMREQRLYREQRAKELKQLKEKVL